MAWGVHAVRVTGDVHDVAEMLQRASQAAQTEGFAAPGDHIAVVAGLPFGHAGSTNLLHVHRLAP
jgi:pyruvate kinase